MIRNLFLSIHEPPGDAEPSRSRIRRLRRGNDPGASYVQPDPDNPGASYVQPDPDNPGASYVQPDPDNPGASYVQPDPDNPRFPGGVPPGVVGTVYSQPFAGFPGCCCCRDKDSEEAASTTSPSHDYSGFVIVRLAADVRPLHFDNLYRLAEELELTGLLDVLELELREEGEASDAAADEPPGQPPRPDSRRRRGKRRHHREETPSEPSREPEGVLRSAPLIDMPALRNPELDPMELRQAVLSVIYRLEGKAATTAFRPLHSLASYWRVDLRSEPDRVDQVVEAFHRLREVDVAYRELSAFDSATGEDFSEDQGYLHEAPVGIGAHWAWNMLQRSPPPEEPVRIVDLEQGWILEHEAFTGSDISDLVYGDNRATPEAPEQGHHGTAVLGQLAATSQVAGAVRQRASFALASHYKGENEEGEDDPFPRTNGHVAAAIFNALAASGDNPRPLRRGDVLLLEVQRGRFPTEIDAADFDAIRLASALGVIVVEAAGNGNYDLDRIQEPVDGRSFRRGDSRFRDSGAIFVGACFAELPHDRAPFSNFGSRVDCFAWGESVTTAGYGDLRGEEVNDYFTNTFSGTSSAAPVIAGAAALMQSLHDAQAQTPLRPRPMRALLSNPETGVRQGPNVGGHIGIMPDLCRIVGAELLVVPQVYLRKRPGDEGAVTRPEDEISSSPDILVWSDPLPVTGDPQASFGSASASAHDPAPGEPLQPGSPNAPRKVFVRLCNRGGGTGADTVHVFAAPAATLTTPERWSPVGPNNGQLTVKTIAQGDTLTVSQELPWQGQPGGPSLPKALDDLGWSSPSELHSLLAVLPQADADPSWPVLPPGPPYFQWSTYRAFLRRRGVAWRNAHRVDVSGGIPTLACYVAGTPDRQRAFDFEIIQRMPQDAKVILAAPSGLAAKLHQRQPWLEKLQQNQGDKEMRIQLPQRRSTRFSRVTLAAHTFPPVWLRVEDPNGSLGWGHSLALRQIWEGEEVGRVTWHFGRS